MNVETATIAEVSSHDEKVPPSLTEDGQSETPRQSRRHEKRGFWQPHTRKIIFACGLCVVPILVFTLTVIALVFQHSVKQSSDCVNTELCPATTTSNITSGTNSLNYYVDFPAARIAFLSSLSSTISLSLVSILMTIYAYFMARSLLQLSDTKDFPEHLPTPYQTSMLVRVLNAELLSLWELGFGGVIRKIFKMKISTWRSDLRSPKLLRNAVLVFICCLFSSLLIQAADTYLHISIESINMVQFYPETADDHQFSRGLASWCLNREVGTYLNKNFWSCGVYPISEEIPPTIQLSNNTLFNEYDVGSNRDYILNYTDTDGVQYAIVGPPRASQDLDWTATSFGVSTQCSPIPFDACNISMAGPTTEDYYFPFNCSADLGAIDIKGNVTPATHQYHYFDAHKYFPERSGPFNHQGRLASPLAHTVGINLTDEDANDVFRNPWHSLNMVGVMVDNNDLPEAFLDSPWIWHEENFPVYFMMSNCTTTVWDVEYAAVGHTVISMSKNKSNGTVAGTPSMATLSSLGFINTQFDAVDRQASTSISTPQSFWNTYMLGISKVFTLPLATHTTGRPARSVQRRVSKVITEIPKAALWCLVVANLMFAFLGITLTIMALVVTTPSVHQVQVRLGVAGLVAQLLETRYSERAIDSDMDLFKKPDDEKGMASPKVGVRRTDTGGSIFTVVSHDTVVNKR